MKRKSTSRAANGKKSSRQKLAPSPRKNLYRDNLRVTLSVNSFTRSKKDPVQINSTVDNITATQSVTFPALSIEDARKSMIEWFNIYHSDASPDLSGDEDLQTVLQRCLSTICSSLGRKSVSKRKEPGQLLSSPTTASKDAEGSTPPKA